MKEISFSIRSGRLFAIIECECGEKITFDSIMPKETCNKCKNSYIIENEGQRFVIKVDKTIPEINVPLNDFVKVRLTKEGVEHYKKHYEDSYRDSHIKAEDVMPKLKEDKDGFVEFQLWKLMLIFGNEMYHGNPKSMFINGEIRFNRK